MPLIAFAGGYPLSFSPVTDCFLYFCIRKFSDNFSRLTLRLPPPPVEPPPPPPTERATAATSVGALSPTASSNGGSTLAPPAEAELPDEIINSPEFKRKKALEEIISTERDYVQDLEALVVVRPHSASSLSLFPPQALMVNPC